MANNNILLQAANERLNRGISFYEEGEEVAEELKSTYS